MLVPDNTFHPVTVTHKWKTASIVTSPSPHLAAGSRLTLKARCESGLPRALLMYPFRHACYLNKALLCSQNWSWSPPAPSFLPVQQLSGSKAELLLCASVGMKSGACPWSQMRKCRSSLWAAQPLLFPKAFSVVHIPGGSLARFESLIPGDRLDVC